VGETKLIFYPPFDQIMDGQNELCVLMLHVDFSYSQF
jgi:hypothetical protein